MANSPNWPYDYIPSAAEWNAVLASKADALALAPQYNVTSATFQLNASYGLHFINNASGNAITMLMPQPAPLGWSPIVKDVTKIVNPSATFAAIIFGGVLDGQNNLPLIQVPGGRAQIYTPDGLAFYWIGD